MSLVLVDIFNLCQDTLADSWPEGCCHNQINFCTQLLFEKFTQIQKLEQIYIAIKGDEYINVTLFPLSFFDKRTEKSQTLDAISGFYLWFVTLDDFDNLGFSQNR